MSGEHNGSHYCKSIFDHTTAGGRFTEEN
jgi:hypothetical protein